MLEENKKHQLSPEAVKNMVFYAKEHYNEYFTHDLNDGKDYRRRSGVRNNILNKLPELVKCFEGDNIWEGYGRFKQIIQYDEAFMESLIMLDFSKLNKKTTLIEESPKPDWGEKLLSYFREFDGYIIPEKNNFYCSFNKEGGYIGYIALDRVSDLLLVKKWDAEKKKEVKVKAEEILRFILSDPKTAKICVNSAISTPELPYGYNTDPTDKMKKVFNLWENKKNENIPYIPYISRTKKKPLQPLFKAIKHENLLRGVKLFKAYETDIFSRSPALTSRFVTILLERGADLQKRFDDIFCFLGTQGNGKSSICNILLSRLAGKSAFLKCNLMDLNKTFNSSLQYKSFLLFDESTTISENHGIYDRLKDLSSKQEELIEEKFTNPVRSYANYNPIIVSNHAHPFHMEKGDRRTSIFWTDQTRAVENCPVNFSTPDPDDEEAVEACVLLIINKYYNPDIIKHGTESYRNFQKERTISVLAYNDMSVYIGKDEKGKVIDLKKHFEYLIKNNSNICVYELTDEELRVSRGNMSEFKNLQYLLPSLKISGKNLTIDRPDLELIKKAWLIRNPEDDIQLGTPPKATKTESCTDFNTKSFIEGLNDD